MARSGFCDLVPPCFIPADRMRQIEKALAASSRLVGQYKMSSGLCDSIAFFAAFMKAYREGANVFVGEALIPAEHASVMIGVKDIESELLSGFSLMIQKATVSCGRSYGRDPEDLQAEAYQAFFRAMINYSGETMFSTYLWYSLTRNLSRACLDKGELKVPRDVRKIAMRVVNAMNAHSMTFDDAVAAEGVPDGCVSKVVSAMSRVHSTTELEIRPSDLATCEDSESFGWVSNAVEVAGLGRLERAVLAAFMSSPSHSLGLTEGCRDMINPDTGKPYSRAALSAAWKQAKKKIARAMEAAA